MNRCQSRQEVIDLLMSSIDMGSCPRETMFEICDAVAPSFAMDAPATPPRGMVFRGLGRRKIYYAIHEDDLLLFKTSVLVVVLFFTSSSLSQLAARFIASLVALVYTFRKKAIELDCGQAIVLKTLRSHSAGISTDELSNLCQPLLDSSQVTKILASLQRTFKMDGTQACLVAQDEQDVWHAVDV